MHFVPSMLNVFVDYLDGKSDAAMARLASVRRIFASGEALASSHVKTFNTVWGAKTGARADESVRAHRSDGGRELFRLSAAQ